MYIYHLLNPSGYSQCGRWSYGKNEKVNLILVGFGTTVLFDRIIVWFTKNVTVIKGHFSTRNECPGSSFIEICYCILQLTAYLYLFPFPDIMYHISGYILQRTYTITSKMDNLWSQIHKLETILHASLCTKVIKTHRNLKISMTWYISAMDILHHLYPAYVPS